MEGISFAHINLDDTYWGIVCDSLGFFRMRVNPGQKLKVSALGFKEQIVSILPPTIEDEIFQEIYMERESYLLEEVNVYSLGSWEDFKENFVKEELPEEENIAESFDFGNLRLEQAKANTIKREGFGITLGGGINPFKSGGKKAKGLRVPNQLEVIHEQILQSKFNKELVAEITKENGKRLDLLMEYINSRSNFTHQTSEYYIGSKIKQLYDEFLQENPNWDENFTFTDSLGKIPNHLRP